ncbi:MAG: hypothetical protein IK077_11735 [Thermoguttaceae bacterium]|nr:hypothetical protein [Thermoguttaceae bacterium]
MNFSVALVGLGSSSRAATPVADYPPAAGRASFGDALRVIRAASGRRRSPPDAAGKQGDALVLIGSFIGSYEPNVDSNRRLSAR